MHCKVLCPKVISSFVNICTEETTTVQIGTTETNIVIQNDIREGCTGSTILFKIISCLIIEELEKNYTGFVNGTV